LNNEEEVEEYASVSIEPPSTEYGVDTQEHQQHPVVASEDIVESLQQPERRLRNSESSTSADSSDGNASASKSSEFYYFYQGVCCIHNFRVYFSHIPSCFHAKL